MAQSGRSAGFLPSVKAEGGSVYEHHRDLTQARQGAVTGSVSGSTGPATVSAPTSAVGSGSGSRTRRTARRSRSALVRNGRTVARAEPGAKSNSVHSTADPPASVHIRFDVQNVKVGASPGVVQILITLGGCLAAP